MQVRSSQKSKLKGKLKGMVHCFVFALLVGKERSHMLRFALCGFASVLFVGRELSHVTA